MQRNVKIKSASLHKEIFLKGNYDEVMGRNGEQFHAFKCTVPVHQDLRLAFAELREHAIALADIHDANGKVSLERISVHGFTISGNDDNEGVTLHVTRTLENGKEVILNTPFQLWDDQVNPYLQADDLSEIIERCKGEVYQYVFEDKHQPTNQIELFDAAAADAV